MAPVNMTNRDFEFVVSEANGDRSRDAGVVTVPANTTFAAGTVLGQLTADGKFVRHDPALATGAENESAILGPELVNDTGAPVDFTAALLVRDAVVNGASLVYEDGADANQITTSNAALSALGIIVR